MLSFYKIKPQFQKLLKPVLVLLHNWGISPNAITWLSILLSVSTGIIFWIHPFGFIFLLLPMALILRMALNALDGMMARTYNLQSKQGEILNELGDVISDLVMFFPFILLAQPNQMLTFAFLFLSIINEYSGILGKAVSGIRRYEGPMGKSDRAFLIGAICIVLYFYPNFTQYLNIIFFITILLLCLSTASRIFNTLKKK